MIPLTRSSDRSPATSLIRLRASKWNPEIDERENEGLIGFAHDAAKTTKRSEREMDIDSKGFARSPEATTEQKETFGFSFRLSILLRSKIVRR